MIDNLRKMTDYASKVKICKEQLRNVVLMLIFVCLNKCLPPNVSPRIPGAFHLGARHEEAQSSLSIASIATSHAF